MSHTLTLFLNIKLERTQRKMEEAVSNMQFGFREGLETRETLFGVNIPFLWDLDVNQDFCHASKILRKKVRYDKLLRLLISKKIHIK